MTSCKGDLVLESIFNLMKCSKKEECLINFPLLYILMGKIESKCFECVTKLKIHLEIRLPLNVNYK